MTATIHRIPNWQHEGAVLAERHRRAAIDPLWREQIIAQRSPGLLARLVGRSS